MFLSLAFILLLGMGAGWICKKIQMPSLLGMLFVGVLLGPYALNLIDVSILNISAELRKIALIIILTRAGLSLEISDLKKVGRPAVLMCFVPACVEMLGMILLAPKILGISVLDAAILGAVVAAVSPAVIVPRMINLIENGYGTKQSIPQMILAGASVDDVFVIVVFSSLSGLAQSGDFSVMSLVRIPISIVLGILIGMGTGLAIGNLFKKYHMRDTVKIICSLSLSFFLVALEDILADQIPFSSLIAVMCIGIALQTVKKEVTVRLSAKYNKMWVAAEILLFVLVGATVDIHYALAAGGRAVILLLLVMLFRMAGVYLCVAGTKLSFKERLFCMEAYLPKATVQAAIGGIPLSLGLSCGNIVLTVAVLSILISAPLGAFLIDHSYKKLLQK